MGKFSEFISALKDIKEEDEYEKFCRKHMEQFKVTLEEISDDDWQEVQDVVLSCIEVGLENVMEFAYLIVEKKNLIKWKQHKEVLDAILDYLAQHGRKDNIRKLNPYGEFVSRLVKLLQALQLSRAYVDKLCALIDSALSNRRARLLRAVRELNDIPYTKKSDWTISILGRICDIAEENPEMEETEAIALCANRVLHEILDECWQNAKQAARYRDHMVRLFRFCSTQKWETNNPEKKSVCYILTRTTMNRYISLHSQCNRIVEAMAPLVKPLTKCSDKTVARDASIYLDDVAGQIGVDDAKAEEVINKFLNGNPKSSDAAAKFVDIYKSNPSAFNNKYEAIASSMDDKDTEEYIIRYVTEFFKEVVVKDPSKITKGCLKYLIKSIEVDMSANALNVLTPLVEKNKDILVPFEKELLGLMKDYKMFATHGLCGILGNMASENEARSAKYLKVLVDLAKVSENMYRTVVFMAIRQIGEPYPQHLIKYEDYFTPFLEDSTMKDYAVYVIDAMHQRSLATVTQDIEEAKDDVEELDERVTAAEEKVDDVDKDVTQTKVDVAIVKKEVNEQGERLDELGEVVEETIEKVEEMDKKTLSHAPAWCKDVSRIMNEKSDNDWRLLSTKLGYSNDDIRNWATQADPCLSLFDEWFATHKSKAAISKILGIVEEMNRLDAAMIVENALKQAEDVADAEDHDYDTPPDLFISYQWGVQEDVKLLKNHLEMAGYESWMDVGQMGGGDKLFQKIDRGIRAAKVVLCCVTEEYTKSPNCNREVNLSVNLGKPIIPLLMEKMSWPPSGSMGPIFGEYLFIRFFARQGECANDDRYWPTAKFQELLMQLRYNIIPNDSLICDPYRGWESPPEEMIIIQPKTQENKSSVVSANITLNEEPSPDVFISYQWGKQPQIKALYKKLTEMGYSCWLDIMQMGGGDSLYDKIDKGVRGCKIVLICVTTKYSLSANCRREVSLADAIKKPIVPLLLEKITWPPEGPMGMVFTQLLYINFCKHDVDVQNHWECPQMEELFSKINEQIPYMAVDIVPSDETYDKNETKLTINGTNNDFHKEKNNQPIEEEPKEDHMSFNPSNKESQIQSTSYSPEEQQNEKDNDTNEESTNKESQNKAQESNGNNPAASTPKGNEKSSSCNIL